MVLCLLKIYPPIFYLILHQMFPDVSGEMGAGLSSGGFLTCSADNTIRLWQMENWAQTHNHSQNILSNVSLASNITKFNKRKCK